MQNLPNMMVLDFCEWLRKQVASGKNNKADALDIILNEEYRSRLGSYKDSKEIECSRSTCKS